MMPAVQHVQDVTLIEAHGGNLWTTSQKIASKFKKRHDNVLRAILNLECSPEFSRLNFEERDYFDERGKTQPGYRISQDGFSFLAMGFTGANAGRWKEDSIKTFNKMERDLSRIAMQKADPVRQLAVRDKCAIAGMMTDCLKDTREAQGKATKAHHYRNEHGLCNWTLTGSYTEINDDDLDGQALRRLRDIRRQNARLILQGLNRHQRRDALREKFPLLQLGVAHA